MQNFDEAEESEMDMKKLKQWRSDQRPKDSDYDGLQPLEKLKTIAHEFVESCTDSRSYQEVYDHMVDWFQKGWLNLAFVNGAYGAISDGKAVVFQYEPGKYYGYLAGESEEQIYNILSKAEREGWEVRNGNDG